MSTATRQDYATAAAAALLSDEAGNRTCEVGGPAYDVTGLAQLITDVTGTKVTYRDLPIIATAVEGLARYVIGATGARAVMPATDGGRRPGGVMLKPLASLIAADRYRARTPPE